MVAEELCRRHGWGRWARRFSGLLLQAELCGRDVVMVMPQTYMNLSGDSIGPTARHFRVPVSRIIALHDEVEIPFGDVRLKQGGGLGGHNGLRSMERVLGSRDFWRVRVGVGRPADTRTDLADWVLSPFTEPAAEVEAMIATAASLVEDWVEEEG